MGERETDGTVVWGGGPRRMGRGLMHKEQNSIVDFIYSNAVGQNSVVDFQNVGCIKQINSVQKKVKSFLQEQS